MKDKKKKTLIIFEDAHNFPEKACEGSSFIINLGFIEQSKYSLKNTVETADNKIKEFKLWISYQN